MSTAVQHTVIAQVQKLRRSAATLTAVAGYLLFVWGAGASQMVHAPVFAVAVALAIVGVGLLLWSLASDLGAEWPAVTLPLAIWAHVALVSTAILAETPLRLLLLAATLLSLTFAALHLTRQQLVWVAVAAWVTYGATTGLLELSGVAMLGRDLVLNWVGYSAAIVGGLLVAREVARLREELSGRTRELEVALTKVRELAMRDDLTGLFNRRQLLEYLQRQKALADREALTFAICYVDLDHFKRVNDRFGHKQGDDVLQAFAEVARRVVREEDFVARMGGEEFVLVLINANVTDAVRVADRLRRQTQLMVIHPDAPDFAVTASVGIAAYRRREAIEQLLNRADAAMYAAKSQGRNRVVVAPGIETESMRGTAAR